jgi:hypothetical protein
MSTSTPKISPLRQRMIDDLRIRKLDVVSDRDPIDSYTRLCIPHIERTMMPQSRRSPLSARGRYLPDADSPSRTAKIVAIRPWGASI